MNDERIVRIWRQGIGLWWAELWLPRTKDDPPAPDPRLSDPAGPPGIDGFTRRDVKSAMTRWGALRLARRLAVLSIDDIPPVTPADFRIEYL